MRILIAAAVLAAIATPAAAQQQMWVKSDTLNRRTCPSTTCGVVGNLMYRESAMVYETSNGWSRITEPYDASCVGGVSEYVDSGNAACTPENGIVFGEFSEWVSSEFLAADRASDPAAGATGMSAVVAGSDDFRLHEAAFVAAAEQLIGDGTCSETDFAEWGGWIKSSNRSGPVYFMYCGPSMQQIYLNAETGAITP